MDATAAPLLSVVYEVVGGVKSCGMPVNSSAPTSGVDALRIWPSKSSVIPETGVPPLSSWVATALLMCRKFALEPVVLRNGGFSLNDALSRVATRILYAAIVVSEFVPSLKIVGAKKSLLFDVLS